MKTIFVLISFIVYTTAYICCPPTQYEGKLSEIGGFYVKPTKNVGWLVADANIHTDRKNGRVGFLESMDSSGQITKVQLVQDYQKEVQYLVINGACAKTVLSGTIDDNVCIPDNAKFIMSGDYDIGALQVNLYSYNVMQLGANISAYVAVASDSCVPVNLWAMSSTGTVTTIVSGGYYNFTKGIKDPSVFDVPDVCDHALPSIKEIQAPLSGSGLMKALIEQFKYAWYN